MPLSSGLELDFVSQIVVIPASGSKEIRLEFKPDQMIAASLSGLTNGVDIFPDGVAGHGGIPLRGIGPVHWPGVTDQQKILFTNLDTVERTIRLIAQRGYSPVSLNLPVTGGLAASTEMVSKVIYHEKVGAGDYTGGDAALPPTGQVWEIQHASIYNLGGIADEIRVEVYQEGPAGHVLAQIFSPADHEAAIWSGQITLKNGAYMKFVWKNVADGDPLMGTYRGYRLV